MLVSAPAAPVGVTPAHDAGGLVLEVILAFQRDLHLHQNRGGCFPVTAGRRHAAQIERRAGVRLLPATLLHELVLR